MKSLRDMPGLAVLLVVSFITFTTFGTALTSCGSSSQSPVSDGDDGDDGDGGTATGVTFSTFQQATTDSTGKATFTTSKLTNATSAEITLTLPTGQPASGLTVDFSETSDGRVMFVAYDANGTYQTAMITADVSNLTADISTTARAIHLESGAVTPVGIEKHGKDFGITTLILIAGASLFFAVNAISLQDKIRHVSGTIDAERLAKGEPDCFSIDDLLDHFDIATSAFGLVCWTMSTFAFAGVNLTMDGLYEIVLENIADNIKDTVEQLFWDEVLASTMGALSITRSTDMCWQLHDPFSKWGKVIEMRPDKLCTTAADCENMTDAVQDFDNIDGDLDGYTVAQSDCDDQDRTKYPGAPEICGDGIDQDCSGADTACTVTTQAFMDKWPVVDGGSLLNNGSGDASLVHYTGNFSGTGAGSITEARVFVNDFREQKFKVDYRYDDNNAGFTTYIGLTSGLNRIQVAGQSGAVYGSDTKYFTNTGTQPSLTLMLVWDECQDLRLHITEPNGTQVASASDTGSVGGITYPPVGRTPSGWGPVIYSTTSTVDSGTFQYYVTYNGCSDSCGSETCGTANYTVRAFTPSGSLTNTGSLASGAESTHYQAQF